MLLFQSMMALKFVSNFSLKFCNILSNNPTGSSYFDCFSVCYIILISFLADLSSGHISSHLGFFGSSKDICRRRSGQVLSHRGKTLVLLMKMFQSKKADSILTCAQMCRREAACKGANFLANKTTRSLFVEGQQARKVDGFVKRNGSI